MNNKHSPFNDEDAMFTRKPPGRSPKHAYLFFFGVFTISKHFHVIGSDVMVRQECGTTLQSYNKSEGRESMSKT